MTMKVWTRKLWKSVANDSTLNASYDIQTTYIIRTEPFPRINCGPYPASFRYHWTLVIGSLARFSHLNLSLSPIPFHTHTNTKYVRVIPTYRRIVKVREWNSDHLRAALNYDSAPEGIEHPRWEKSKSNNVSLHNIYPWLISTSATSSLKLSWYFLALTNLKRLQTVSNQTWASNYNDELGFNDSNDTKR